MKSYLVDVWVTLPGGTMKAGEFVCNIALSNGKARGAFRYTQEYCALSAAYALDPVSLKFNDQGHSIDHPGVFGIFQDSLPDDWGKRLLIRKHHLPRGEQNLPGMLIALGAAGLGALSYSEHGRPLPSATETSMLTLERLVYEAELFEEGACDDADIVNLLSAGSSPGGARPKALVYDAESSTHFLAKFPSRKDNVDVVRIEAATLSLAAQAGLRVPTSRLIECGGRPVLLVERFDVTEHGRRHMASMQTLLKAEGFYQCRYRELLDLVRKVSADPATDSGLIFRQMVFNAVIGNTDDHLKNFWMTCDSFEGWRLSPSFDLVPDISRAGEHVLFFDLGGYYPGRKSLEKLGRAWGVSKATDIVEEVYAAVQRWREEYTKSGVTEGDSDTFREIDGNVKAVAID